MCEWWRTFFGSDSFFLFSDDHEMAADAGKEAAGVARILSLTSESQVLDIGCGWGRHCVALAGIGVQMVGLDITERMVEEARRRAALETTRAECTFCLGDFRSLPFGQGSFDAVISMHTSLGFSEQDEDDVKTFQEARRVLRPGGHFLIDMANYFRRPPYQKQCKSRGCLRLLEEKWFDYETRRVRVRWQVYEGNSCVEDWAIGWRAFAPEEITGELLRLGFADVRSCGDFGGRRFDADTERMIVIGRTDASA